MFSSPGKEIPRSYVSHLEERVAFLEEQLSKVQDGVLPDTHNSHTTTMSKKRKVSELELDPSSTAQDSQTSSRAKHDHESNQATMTDVSDDKENVTQFKSDLGNLVSSVSIGNDIEGRSRRVVGLSSGIS